MQYCQVDPPADGPQHSGQLSIRHPIHGSICHPARAPHRRFIGPARGCGTAARTHRAGGPRHQGAASGPTLVLSPWTTSGSYPAVHGTPRCFPIQLMNSAACPMLHAKTLTNCCSALKIAILAARTIEPHAVGYPWIASPLYDLVFCHLQDRSGPRRLPARSHPQRGPAAVQKQPVPGSSTWCRRALCNQPQSGVCSRLLSRSGRKVVLRLRNHPQRRWGTGHTALCQWSLHDVEQCPAFRVMMQGQGRGLCQWALLCWRC